MSAFRIDCRHRGARKWLADPRRRFFTERATAEADLEGIDQDQWETRIVDILRDEEPDYRARLQLEGRWEHHRGRTDRPCAGWSISPAAVKDCAWSSTTLLAGARRSLRSERHRHAQKGFIPELQIPPMRDELTD